MLRRPAGAPVVAAVLVVILVAAAAAVLLTRGDATPDRATAKGGGSPGSTGAPQTTEEPPPVTAPADTPKPPYDVIFTDLTFTDPDTDRSVEAAVWYPDAPTRSPLVVFAHGFATSPETYWDFLFGLATRGYVVVAPRSYATRTSFSAAFRTDEEPPPDPGEGGGGGSQEGESGSGGGGGYALDFDDQRRDIITAINVMTGDAPDELQGRIAKSQVAVIGHSDGGISAAAVAFNTFYGDTRVRAAVIVAGDYGYFAGDWFPSGSPALLALHGDADGVNPISSSFALYEADGGGTKYMVVAHGVGHLDMLTYDPPITDVDSLIDDFFTSTVRGDQQAVTRMFTDTQNSNELEIVASSP